MRVNLKQVWLVRCYKPLCELLCLFLRNDNIVFLMISKQVPKPYKNCNNPSLILIYGCIVLKACKLELTNWYSLYEQSFSLDRETGKKCYMIGARGLSIVWGDSGSYWKWPSLPESRYLKFFSLDLQSNA